MMKRILVLASIFTILLLFGYAGHSNQNLNFANNTNTNQSNRGNSNGDISNVSNIKSAQLVPDIIEQNTTANSSLNRTVNYIIEY